MMDETNVEYEVVEVTVDDSVSPAVARAYIRVTDGQRAPFGVFLCCRRNMSVWRTTQPWRGGLPHRNPDARRCGLVHERGELDLRSGDLLAVCNDIRLRPLPL